MNYTAYQKFMDDIINKEFVGAPYDNEEYYHHAKMNHTRSNRWDKTAVISEENIQKIKNIANPKHFILITEPWCGDAAHIVPIIAKLAAINPLFTLDIQLRDQEPHLINDYLTNGGKSIPILIVRNEAGEDEFVWGPRPQGASTLFKEMKAKAIDFDTLKEELQKWYNNDKAQEIQNEIVALLSK